MADNITEAEQLIIQLLAALNSTVDSYTASQESDKADATANQLSLTALVVSLAALVVALLQAVLEYVSSNSAQGEKCNTGAIGEYARFAGSRRWSWRHWRRQYFYRELDLDIMYVGTSLNDVDQSEVSNVFKGLKNLHPRRSGNFGETGYSWRYDWHVESSRGLHVDTIRNGIYHLYQRTELGWVPVAPQDLPIKYRLKWFYYLIFCRHRERITPRATWAQLFSLLDVDYRKIRTSRIVGADCIPSTLDVPVQKVNLSDLGVLAFCLGFNKVEISTEDRTISAAGPMGTITTESLPGYGAVVRFQILSPWPRHFVTGHGTPFHDFMCHRNQVLGSFIFPGARMLPLRYKCLRSELDSRERVLEAGYPTVADEAREWINVEHEMQVPGNRDGDMFLQCLKTWRTRQNDEPSGGTRRWPTILLAASVACLPGNSMGFPSSTILRPFMQVFQQMASRLSPVSATWDKLDDPQQGTTPVPLLGGNPWRLLGHQDLKYNSGGFSWAFNKLGSTDLKRVDKILLDQLPALWTWQDRPDPSHKSDPGSLGAMLLEGRLLPYTVELLTCFDPLSWAEAMRSQDPPMLTVETSVSALKVASLRSHVEASNILWTQVLLLDLAMCKIIYQHADLGLDAFKEAKRALVDCWEDPYAEVPLQDLDKFLYRKLFSEEGAAGQAEKVRVLADMIKLRTLCYIAYMMVIPDSTSLYEASLKDPVMLPMI